MHGSLSGFIPHPSLQAMEKNRIADRNTSSLTRGGDMWLFGRLFRPLLVESGSTAAFRTKGDGGSYGFDHCPHNVRFIYGGDPESCANMGFNSSYGMKMPEKIDACTQHPAANLLSD